MRSNTMTSKTSSGCGCAGGTGKPRACGCGCGGQGCGVCDAPPEAYSRPQFFSGQLLTEDDLQSMVDYTVAKNRLHNRMLFGEGVACGLRVTTDVCEPERHLIVRPGYAIDCCGNDIVVPCEARLDVVELVRDLRTRMLGKDCGDPCRDRDEYDCPDQQDPVKMPAPEPAGAAPAAAPGEIQVVAGPARPREPVIPDRKRNSYCLYVVYCEQPADPVAPYDGVDSCGGGECHHTRVREGYRFELRCGKPSGCEKRRQIEPSKIIYQGNTGKALGIYELLGKAQAGTSSLARERVLESLRETMIDTPGAYETPQATLIEQARRLSLTQAGQTRFNTIIALLLVGWLRKVDCDALMPDCPPCDEDGVLIACFDFEDCKISNLCAQRRLQILSPGYFAQLGVAQVWRCMRIAACCRPDKYTTTTSVIGRIRDVGFELRDLRSDRVAVTSAYAVETAPARAADAGVPPAPVAEPAAPTAPPPPGAPAPAAPAALVETVAAAEISLEELQDFLKARVARLDNADVPEYQATLLPELVRAFDAQVTRAPVEAQVRDETLHKEIADLRGQLDKVKQDLATMVRGTKGKGQTRQGDNP